MERRIGNLRIYVYRLLRTEGWSLFVALTIDRPLYLPIQTFAKSASAIVSILPISRALQRRLL